LYSAAAQDYLGGGFPYSRGDVAENGFMAFAGFSREALRFLTDLERNNNRDWFQPRKEEYEGLVRTPMLELVTRVNDLLEKQAPDYVTEPSKAVYRIYRDIRFSPNKTPYKTHIGALLWHRELGKSGGAAFYFHVSTKELLIAGGLYMAPPEILTPVRQHIGESHERLRSILKRKAVRDELGDLHGESMARPPKGWTADHPAIDLLKRKNLLLEVELPAKTAVKPEALSEITRRIRAMVPFIQYLNEPLLSARSKPKDPLTVRRNEPTFR
jgi:uncharacterized protein (TIGR02453 family)